MFEFVVIFFLNVFPSHALRTITPYNKTIAEKIENVLNEAKNLTKYSTKVPVKQKSDLPPLKLYYETNIENKHDSSPLLDGQNQVYIIIGMMIVLIVIWLGTKMNKTKSYN